MTLSVVQHLRAGRPRFLRGMLPSGVRTFLPAPVLPVKALTPTTHRQNWCWAIICHRAEASISRFPKKELLSVSLLTTARVAVAS